jgi:hypothetical protein
MNHTPGPLRPAFTATTDAAPFPAAWFDTVFLVPDPPPSWPPRFAVVTAHDPGGVRCAEADNRRLEGELDDFLAREGLPSFVVTGASPDLRHREPGRGFAADSPGQASAIASRFGQLGFFWVEDGTVFVAVDASGRGWRVARWEERLSTLP